MYLETLHDCILTWSSWYKYFCLSLMWGFTSQYWHKHLLVPVHVYKYPVYMLINIFSNTYSQTKVILFSDNVGNALERLKNEVSWNYKVSEMENYMMNKDFALVLEHTCTCIYIWIFCIPVCLWLAGWGGQDPLWGHRVLFAATPCRVCQGGGILVSLKCLFFSLLGTSNAIMHIVW